MTRTSPATVLVYFFMGACAGWGILSAYEKAGGVTHVSWATGVMFVGFAVMNIVLGWPIRQWNAGRRDQVVNPLHAARVVAFARASSRAGALFAGWFCGHVVVLLPDLAVEPRRDRLVAALLVAIGAAAVCCAGVVVERWCALPPSDDADLVT